MKAASDQLRVQAQLCKLLLYAERTASIAGPVIMLAAAGDDVPAVVEAHSGSFTVVSHGVQTPTARPEVLRLLSIRPVAELLLGSSITYAEFVAGGPLRVPFAGPGLDTVVWDAIELPCRVLSDWQRRVWKLLVYLQTSGGNCRVTVHFSRGQRAVLGWLHDRFSLSMGSPPAEHERPTPWAVVSWLERLARPVEQLVLGTASDEGDACGMFIRFEAPCFRNPWD